MRVKLTVSLLLAFFALVGSAQAFHWHIRYWQARHASREFVEGSCRKDRACTGYGVGQCHRISESRFDCEIGIFYADTPGLGEEVECNLVLHWGAGHGGRIELKNHGLRHCFQV